jgi:hypothetical protein
MNKFSSILSQRLQSFPRIGFEHMASCRESCPSSPRLMFQRRMILWGQGLVTESNPAQSTTLSS